MSKIYWRSSLLKYEDAIELPKLDEDDKEVKGMKNIRFFYLIYFGGL